MYPLDAVYDNPEDVPEDVREKYIIVMKIHNVHLQNFSSSIFLLKNCIGES